MAQPAEQRDQLHPPIFPQEEEESYEAKQYGTVWLSPAIVWRQQKVQRCWTLVLG
jgi:hypothetical protein